MTKKPGIEIFGFTPAETRIVPLLAKGFSQQEIADDLKISVNTVYCQLKMIRQKMKVKTSLRCAAILAHYF